MRADLALVEREEHGALDGLVEEGVVAAHHGGEDDVGRLAAELDRHGDEALRRLLEHGGASWGRPGEGDLGDALALSERGARLGAVPRDHVDHARRHRVLDQLHEHLEGWGEGWGWGWGQGWGWGCGQG